MIGPRLPTWGSIPLPSDYQFVWHMTGRDIPEVYGSVHDDNGPVSKYHGWYRCVDPNKAACIVTLNLYGDCLITREEAGL
jgi:hypothetical protein